MPTTPLSSDHLSGTGFARCPFALSSVALWQQTSPHERQRMFSTLSYMIYDGGYMYPRLTDWRDCIRQAYRNEYWSRPNIRELASAYGVPTTEFVTDGEISEAVLAEETESVVSILAPVADSMISFERAQRLSTTPNTQKAWIDFSRTLLHGHRCSPSSLRDMLIASYENPLAGQLLHHDIEPRDGSPSFRVTFLGTTSMLNVYWTQYSQDGLDQRTVAFPCSSECVVFRIGGNEGRLVVISERGLVFFFRCGEQGHGDMVLEMMTDRLNISEPISDLWVRERSAEIMLRMSRAYCDRANGLSAFRGQGMSQNARWMTTRAERLSGMPFISYQRIFGGSQTTFAASAAQICPPLPRHWLRRQTEIMGPQNLPVRRSRRAVSTWNWDRIPENIRSIMEQDLQLTLDDPTEE